MGNQETILRMNGGGKNERQAPPHHEAEHVMILKSELMTLAFLLIIAMDTFLVHPSIAPIYWCKDNK